MRNSYEVFEEQLPMVCREYKHLKIRQQNGQKYLWGTIDITSPAGEVIQDFLIEIHCHEGFPKRFPILYEIGGYIPREADWHKYSDDSCCITADPVEILACKSGISLYSFIKDHVIPYLANQYFRKNFGHYKNEYAHGINGIFQAYCDIMKTPDITSWKRYIACAFGSTSINISRNAPCFCGSGKKYKHCHMQVFQDIRDIGKETIVQHMRMMQVM